MNSPWEDTKVGVPSATQTLGFRVCGLGRILVFSGLWFGLLG